MRLRPAVWCAFATLALAACGGDVARPSDGGLDAADMVDADVAPPTLTLLAEATPFALLTTQTIQWRTDEAGAWKVTLGGSVIASGTATAGEMIGADVIGAQLSASMPTTIRVDLTDGAGNVGAASTMLTLVPPVLVPNSVVNSFELVVRPDGKRVYVTAYDMAKVLVIDADPASSTHDTVIAQVSVGSQPEGLAITADGSRLYVGQNNGIAVIATASNTVTTTIPVTGHVSGMVIGKGSRLYAITTAIQVIDVAPASATYHQIVRSFSRSLLHFGRWAVTADGSRAVLAWSGFLAYSVEIVDLDPASASYGTALFTPVPVIPGPAPGPGVALSAAGTAYTAILGINSTTPLGAINIATGVTGPTYGGQFHAQGSVSLATGYLLHSGLSSNALQVIRASDLSLVGTLPLAAQGELLGRFVAISPDESRAWLLAPSGHYMVQLY